MIRSMTAFARAEGQNDWGSAYWELRSVNNRYLDVSVRMPEDFRFLEQSVREQVTKRTTRGKVECSLRINFDSQRADAFQVDLALAKQIVGAGRQIAEHFATPAEFNVMEVLRWPGVFQANPPDLDSVAKVLRSLLDTALTDLVATREREGEKIAQMLLERCEGCAVAISGVRERLPSIVAEARTRLTERVAEVKENFDAERIEQEIVIFAQKTDVAEELDRLDAHIGEVRRVLGERKPVGRRLDFLMQEMNREANTLGSKSADASTTRASVELKVLIEQMREQIQNVE